MQGSSQPKTADTGMLHCLEAGRSPGQLDDALHAVWKALGAELGQNNGQDGVMVAGQEVMVHALPYNPIATTVVKRSSWLLQALCQAVAKNSSMCQCE